MMRNACPAHLGRIWPECRAGSFRDLGRMGGPVILILLADSTGFARFLAFAIKRIDEFYACVLKVNNIAGRYDEAMLLGDGGNHAVLHWHRFAFLF